ncbi:hypothetical protein LCGC14_1448890 [marine sediment metagenome]|uniref:Uncharacterized protein n=1 Tax=marine sediment metagenome TaxID=412755 RepID=A0A0F9JJ41_9ZZZZ
MEYDDFARYWPNSWIGIHQPMGHYLPYRIDGIGGQQVVGVIIKNSKGNTSEHNTTFDTLNTEKNIFKIHTVGMVNDKKGVFYVKQRPARQWRKGFTVTEGRVSRHLPFTPDFLKQTKYSPSKVGAPHIIWSMFNPHYYDIHEIATLLRKGRKYGGAIAQTMALCMSETSEHSVLVYKENTIGRFIDNKIHLQPRMFPYADHVKRELGVEVVIDE